MYLNKLFFPVFLFFTVSFSGIAQNFETEFGTVKPEQLNMKTFDRDLYAEAVVLYDVGKTIFYDNDDGFRIIFERTTRVKILKDAGIKFGTVEIPFYIEFDKVEKVYSIEANTYNIENGAIKKSNLDYNTIFEEKVNDHWRVKKFALPDVKEGSVIEYTYKIISPYFFNLHDWEFQQRIPVIYSEYTVGMIPFYEYTYIFQGASKFDVYRVEEGSSERYYGGVKFADNMYTFGMKNIPAFKDEEFITSVNDYIMKIDFQLSVIHYPSGARVNVITTWPLLIQDVLKLSEFGGYIKAATRNAEEIVASLGIDTKSDREKAVTITNYVKANFNWNGSSSKFADQPCKDFLKLKTGNSAEINLFLCSLLNAAGVQAYPVLLSTRDHGKVHQNYPFQQFLNYEVVLIYLDNIPVLLDGTEPLSPFGMLPARCINESGLVVNKEKLEWIPLTDNSNSIVTDSLHIVLNEVLDSSKVEITIRTDGHKAMDYRRSSFTKGELFKKEFIDDDMVVTRPFTIEQQNNIDKPFLIKYSMNVPVEKVGNKIVITPFPGLTPEENPLKMGYRTYPVDMIYAETNNFEAFIEIPKGYQFSGQHKSVAINNSLVSINYISEIVSGKVHIQGSYSFKKPVYQKQEYYDLKNYYSNIVETFNSKIVLVKQQE